MDKGPDREPATPAVSDPRPQIVAEPVDGGPPAEPTTGATPGARGRGLLAVVAAVVVTGSIMLAVLVARSGAPAASTQPAPVATTTVAPAAPDPLPGVAVPKWTGEDAARWTGGARRSYAFEVPAEQEVEVWLRRVRPRLVVRCADGETEVFVFTESAAKIEPETEDHTVRYRFDADPEMVERWADSTEHDGLFAPLGASFAERLKGARTLAFGFTPHNAAPVSMQFPVAGLRDVLEPVEKGCRPRK
jgi:hypothetical protein